MDAQELRELESRVPLLERVAAKEQVEWANPLRRPMDEVRDAQELGVADIDDAEARLARFAPLITECFPETASRGGIIESDLVEVPAMRRRLNEAHDAGISGRLLLKKDSHLAIAGSVKARGGIYEVLRHTEDLALEAGLLTPAQVAGKEPSAQAYRALAGDSARRIFSRHSIKVGSTGNLGMSIGIMSAVLGYRVEVYMSSDARQWKKERLRSFGAQVLEFETDYGTVVAQARKASEADPTSYFVDDENSRALFLGYAVAARRVAEQLDVLGVAVDEDHPLFVYVPCGVGGAPGGVSFGLRHQFGDFVHCLFVEPTTAPCMLAGMASGLHSGICVQDLGLDGHTHADGLAVGRPSGFVGKFMEPHFAGGMTVNDALLYDYMRDLVETEDIFIEPSACAAFQGPARIERSDALRGYLEAWGVSDKMADATHVVWATGGSLVPGDERAKYMTTHLS